MKWGWSYTKKYKFNVANNEGFFTSIYLFKEHKKIYPDVNYIKKLSLIRKNSKGRKVFDVIYLNKKFSGNKNIVL